MRETDRPESMSLGQKIVPSKATPVTKEPMWKPIASQPGYLRSTDGAVKKVGD